MSRTGPILQRGVCRPRRQTGDTSGSVPREPCRGDRASAAPRVTRAGTEERSARGRTEQPGRRPRQTMKRCSRPSWAMRMTLRLEVQMSRASRSAPWEPGEAGCTGGTWYVLMQRSCGAELSMPMLPSSEVFICGDRGRGHTCHWKDAAAAASSAWASPGQQSEPGPEGRPAGREAARGCYKDAAPIRRILPWAGPATREAPVCGKGAEMPTPLRPDGVWPRRLPRSGRRRDTPGPFPTTQGSKATRGPPRVGAQTSPLPASPAFYRIQSRESSGSF